MILCRKIFSGLTFEKFQQSFRDEEVVSKRVRVLEDGETVRYVRHDSFVCAT